MAYAWEHPELAESAPGVRQLVSSDAIVPLIPSHPRTAELTEAERDNLAVMQRFGFKGGFAASFPDRIHGRMLVFSTCALSSEELALFLYTELGESVATSIAMFLEGLAVRELMANPQYVPLSLREQECLALVSNGHTTKRIATRLGLTARTVNEHVSNACTKLRASNRTQAATRAMLKAMLL